MKSHKHTLYRILSVLAPVAIVSASVFMVEATCAHTLLEQRTAYQACFASFCVIALCIETRVRMGYRLKRGALFWVHLPAAVVFFCLLGTLALMSLPRWVQLAEFVLFVIVLMTGAVLFTRGVRTNFIKGPTTSTTPSLETTE